MLVSLLQTSGDFSHLDLLKENDIPVVFFDRVYQVATSPKITTNDYESAYLATQHLIEQGCKSIGHLSFSGDLSIAFKIKEGYLQALRDHGLPIESKNVFKIINKGFLYIEESREMISGNLSKRCHFYSLPNLS